jgi:enamine deaminase RidA (YjgF/YER057c/UK114 family)
MSQTEILESPVSEVRRAGNMIWAVAIPEDLQTGAIIGDDIATQTRQTIENLALAFAQEGASLADVTQVQVFLTDAADAAGMNVAYRAYFQAPYPVRATVVVKELLDPAMKVEMLATAVLSNAGA